MLPAGESGARRISVLFIADFRFQAALCTDNAAMIAWAGVIRLNGRDGRGDELNEPILKKWPIGSVF